MWLATTGKQLSISREKVPEFMFVEDDEPRYGRSWRHLVWKIYEADPLRCPECGETLQLINIVFEEREIRRILSRLPSPRTWYKETHPPP